jgi:predicted dehydrogenase
MERALRAGVLGIGNIAKSGHVPHYLTHPGVELVALADVDRRRVDSCMEQFGLRRARFGRPRGVHVCSSLEEMLDAGVDLISICVPNRYHAETTITALEAGVDVLCEKPPAVTVAEAEAMAAAAARARRLLLYGLVYRHVARGVLPFIENGWLGRIEIAQASWVRRDYVPPPELQAGALVDLGVHVLDLAWWLMGRPEPLRAGGNVYPLENGASSDVEGAAAGTIIFRHMARLELHTFFRQFVPREEEVFIWLHGRRAGLRLPLPTTESDTSSLLPTLNTEMFGVRVDMTLVDPLPPTVQEGYRRQIEHFVACCRGLEEPIVTPDDGVVLQRMMAALYRSAEQDRQVGIDEV